MEGNRAFTLKRKKKEEEARGEWQGKKIKTQKKVKINRILKVINIITTEQIYLYIFGKITIDKRQMGIKRDISHENNRDGGEGGREK